MRNPLQRHRPAVPPHAPTRPGSRLPGPRMPALRWLRTALLVACTLATGACTDLQLVARQTGDAAAFPRSGSYCFVRAPLATVAGTSDAARRGDAAARSALEQALHKRGYTPALPDDEAALLVDFSLQDGIAANVARLDGPSDYRRSWNRGPIADGTGSMDHTVADSAFRRELTLNLLLRAAGATRSAWEASARQSIPPDAPDADAASTVRRMVARLLEELN